MVRAHAKYVNTSAQCDNERGVRTLWLVSSDIDLFVTIKTYYNKNLFAIKNLSPCKVFNRKWEFFHCGEFKVISTIIKLRLTHP